ncbi:MAG: GHKL domain-containing protein [Eubacteriales bacterium]|nr:GHKL domain-containing protein [Eubacteriales bacterium]
MYVDWRHFPSKKRQGQEGIGLKSMHMIAEKYQGILVMKAEDNRFITKIGLQIPETENS